MSYEQKCLAVDPGLKCDFFVYPRNQYVITNEDGFFARADDESPAWKNAWERLRKEMPG